MITLLCERAIADITQYGKALLKFISPNDVGVTGGHQCGYYLPKTIYPYYTPYPPQRGVNSDQLVRILWQNDRITESMIKWYGKGTRSEYRLTRFGRGFPYLAKDYIGSLLILIPEGDSNFLGYVLEKDEDIEELQASLGIELFESSFLYDIEAPIESEEECKQRLFKAFCRNLENFPSTSWFSEKARDALWNCIADIDGETLDKQLIQCMEAEYDLFRLVERTLCSTEITGPFKDIDEFLKRAARLMNRRKSRAGRSLENHVEFVFRKAGLPFDVRPDVDGRPDIIMPGRKAYYDPDYPTSKLIAVGIKTTCKDRWRQVLNEAKRISVKYILTLQQGISIAQLQEMHSSRVTLIVPRPILHKQYPKVDGVDIMDLNDFIEFAQRTLSI